MQHQCSNCFSEFSDDAPSSGPRGRVFCVFCGSQVLGAPSTDSGAMPFSADYRREEAFALGVISAGGSAFPDTLRQFRAHGTPRGMDSLSPVHTEPEKEASEEPLAPPWRLRKFWTSLAVGFGVGACAAAVFGARDTSQPTVVAASTPKPARPSAPPASPLSGCVVSPTPVVAAAAAVETKPPVTPVLEKRFWLERARSAQHNYRLADAEQLYRRALAQTPRDSEVRSGLGEVELLRGQAAAASSRFRQALEVNSDYIPARIALADLHWQSGQVETARAEYQQIVEQYSEDLVPPHVSQRLEGEACTPQCAEAGPTTSTVDAPRP